MSGPRQPRPPCGKRSFWNATRYAIDKTLTGAALSALRAKREAAAARRKQRKLPHQMNDQKRNEDAADARNDAESVEDSMHSTSEQPSSSGGSRKSARRSIRPVEYSPMAMKAPRASRLIDIPTEAKSISSSRVANSWLTLAPARSLPALPVTRVDHRTIGRQNVARNSRRPPLLVFEVQAVCINVSHLSFHRGGCSVWRTSGR